MKSRTNQAWIQALQQSPGKEQEDAIQDLYDYLFRVAILYLSQQHSRISHWNREDIRSFAEDVAQNALLNILAHLESFQGRSKFTSWTYRFVINQAAGELRRLRYLDISLNTLLADETQSFQNLLPNSRNIRSEQLTEQQDYLNLLRNIIQEELTERQRAAIVGVYLKGYSMIEVANALELTRNALYKLLHDARKQIKTRLEAQHLTQNDILGAFEP